MSQDGSPKVGSSASWRTTPRSPEDSLSHRLRNGVFGLGIMVLSLAFTPNASYAVPFAYGFEIPTRYRVTPGEIVSITGTLVNLGNEPIVFGPHPTAIGVAFPSVQGGVVPNFFFGNSLSADWSISDHGFTSGPNFGVETVGGRSAFFPQFDGVTVAPGKSFPFVFGTFQAPTDQPRGSSALITNVTVELFFTDTVWGTNANLSKLGLFHYVLDNGPSVSFTLANNDSVTQERFRQGMVIDVATGELLSGPRDVMRCDPSLPVPSDCVLATPGLVPEPATFLLWGTTMAGLGLARWRKTRRGVL